MANRGLIRAAIVLAALFFAAVAAAAPRALKPVWQTELGEPVTDAVAAGNRLFVGHAAGVRACSLADGHELWKVDAAGLTSLAADNDNLWLIAGTALRRLDPATGREQAAATLESGGALLAPAPFENRLLLEIAGGSQVRDAASLQLLYQSPAPLFGERAAFLRQSGQWRARLDTGRRQIFFVENGRLRAVDAATGKPAYTVAEAVDLIDWPTVHEDRVFAVNAKKIHCFATKNGKLLWSNRFAAPNPIDPAILTNRADSAALSDLPWHQRLWKWGKRLAGADWEDLLTLHYKNGLVFYFIHRNKLHLSHPLPDEVTLIADDGRFVFWLYTFVDEKDGTTKSVLMRHDKVKEMLYGRSAVAGRGSGFTVFGNNRLYAELAPGYLAELTPIELEPRGVSVFPEDELRTLLEAGSRIVAVSRLGRIHVFPR
ncbi:MAG: PQQ-binding-like beta-propeller repeat protein [Myxococcales bacterium]|nr:PQQ-binding-like beta-propeller repeat protein [Myxococcales bacterium]